MLEAGVRRLVGHHGRAALVEAADAALDHRRFWDAMDGSAPTDLRAIETQIGRRMVAEFGLDLSGLVLDMTNFATFIDSGNDRAPIAQRGKAKQKRTDLRLVGLGAGGDPRWRDPVGGARLSRRPARRHPVHRCGRGTGHPLPGTWPSGLETLTLVYDAGQNCGDNHAVIEASGIGFVGSLPPSDHPDLLEIPRRTYRVVDADRLPRR